MKSLKKLTEEVLVPLVMVLVGLADPVQGCELPSVADWVWLPEAEAVMDLFPLALNF